MAVRSWTAVAEGADITGKRWGNKVIAGMGATLLAAGLLAGCAAETKDDTAQPGPEQSAPAPEVVQLKFGDLYELPDGISVSVSKPKDEVLVGASADDFGEDVGQPIGFDITFANHSDETRISLGVVVQLESASGIATPAFEGQAEEVFVGGDPYGFSASDYLNERAPVTLRPGRLIVHQAVFLVDDTNDMVLSISDPDHVVLEFSE